MIPGKLKLAVLLFLTSMGLDARCQLSLAGYLEGGNNAVYNSSYFNCSVLPSYGIRNLKLESGFSWTFADHQEKYFEGYFIHTSVDVNLFNKNKLKLAGLYLWKPFSDELREINWGFTVTWLPGHFKFVLGNNHRTYKYSVKSSYLNELSRESSRITEPWNLVYEVRYALNNDEKPWNVAFALANFDYFLINQETNPMFHLRATYSILSHTDVIMDIWYKNAGMFNMKVNHFGYSFRLGLQWEITDL